MLQEGAWHLAGFSGPVGQTANTLVPALADPVLAANGGYYLLDRVWNMSALYAMGATINRARVFLANWAVPDYPNIFPISRNALVQDLPRVMELETNPMKLAPNQNLGFQATSDLGTGTEQTTVLAWLDQGLKPAPQGDIYTVRCQSTVTCVPNVWTPASVIVPDVQFPGDTFAVVGAYAVSPGGIAFRFIPRQGILRPGGFMITSPGNRPWMKQLWGRRGLWFEFMNSAPPAVEYLSTSADVNPVVYIQIISRGRPFTPQPSAA